MPSLTYEFNSTRNKSIITEDWYNSKVPVGKVWSTEDGRYAALVLHGNAWGPGLMAFASSREELEEYLQFRGIEPC